MLKKVEKIENIPENWYFWWKNGLFWQKWKEIHVKTNLNFAHIYYNIVHSKEKNDAYKKCQYYANKSLKKHYN